MKNSRNAGRKPMITEEQLNTVRDRYESGESIASIAAEYGMSRQALSKRLKLTEATKEYDIDYIIDGELCTKIVVNPYKETLRIINYAKEISKLAFGWNNAPAWEDLERLVEENYISSMQAGDTSRPMLICQDMRKTTLTPDASLGNLSFNNPDGYNPKFSFTRKDIIIARTSTDGYQIKALSHDRKWFVKSQAIISGLIMDDWAVELVASDICDKLSIPHIAQRECQFVYEDRPYEGVYSKNFELDGYTFISFERLLSSIGESTRDEHFIHLSSIDKLKWCAKELSEIGNLKYEDTLKYMLDMAILDCLVGNVDRHTHNFGLLYNAGTATYCIAPVFDNGMGLFEHDPYRDTYASMEEAMRSVYVAPYGEDPFDMIDILFDEYDIGALYPDLMTLTYNNPINKPFILEYEERMLDYVRSKMDQ